MIVWLIGLAGSGKTTIGSALAERMRLEHAPTVLIDGDAFRAIMGDDLGHTVEDRRKNGERISKLCAALDQQEINVVACVLSLFHEHQVWNRETFSDYVEVYIDVPMSVLEERDQKNLYSGAIAGRIKNVAGVDIPFYPPANADLRIDNASPSCDAKVQADEILQVIKSRLDQSR